MKKIIISLACAAAAFAASITDQRAHTTELELPVNSIAVMQHHSLDMLAQLGALDKVIAVEEKYRAHLGAYFDAICPQCAQLPKPGGLAELNTEELAKLHPDVIIAAAQANPAQVQKLRDLGLKVVTITLRAEKLKDGEQAQSQHLSDADAAYTGGLEGALMILGELVGKQERAHEIWDFAMASRAELGEKLRSLSEKKRVFIANPNQKTYGNDKYVGLQLLRAGAVNVANEWLHGYGTYSFEQLAAAGAQAVIVQDRYMDVYNSFKNEPKYKALPAVKNGALILAPFWAKPWGNPNTDSIALGELWLASELYPQAVDAALVQQRRDEFYKRFYGVDFAAAKAANDKGL